MTGQAEHRKWGPHPAPGVPHQPLIRIQKVIPQSYHAGEQHAGWYSRLWAGSRFNVRTVMNYAFLLLGALVLFNMYLNSSMNPTANEATKSLPAFLLQPIKPPPHPEGVPIKKCFISVAASADQVVTIGKAAERTWVRDMLKHCDVRFFVGNKEWSEKLDFEDMIVRLPVNDEYPPRDKIFAIWRWVYENHGGEYLWYSKVDLDSYVNVDNWVALVDKLSPSDTFVYVGSPGMGRPAERGQLGIKKAYCLGIGYTIGWEALKVMAPQLSTCLTHAKSQHSDTEVGRCMDRSTGLECQRSDPFILNVYGFQVADTYYGYGMHISANGQIMIEFPSKPPSHLYHAALVHPLKKAEFFDDFHRKVRTHLRPVLQRVTKCEGTTEEHCESAKRVVENSCTNNPTLETQLYGYGNHECSAPQSEEKPALDTLPVFVLSQAEDPDSERSYSIVKRLFVASGVSSLHIRKFWRTPAHEMLDGAAALAPNEMAYRNTMRRLIKRAMLDNIPRILVLEEGVLPHIDFETMFYRTMAEPRCSVGIWTQEKGGVLLLGARTVDDGWDNADIDMSISSKANRGLRTLCYNYHQKVSGSFAAIFHQSTYAPILDLLAADESLTFNQALEALSAAGVAVRVSYPNLVIQPIKPDSRQAAYTDDDVTEREGRTMAERDRWVIQKYLTPKSLARKGLRATGRKLGSPAEMEAPKDSQSKPPATQ